ncbi:hypothetical protein ANANG_G00253340 [Anguilla anguilla]|uniref:Uncharacterized protein n=1 Tax=Anguilla anguilla TaxID=7936 RepID=A0A9D3RQS5_ANGAN|nr:hypothetical protein ANANG_G00253340 [Anguilla anguilla]
MKALGYGGGRGSGFCLDTPPATLKKMGGGQSLDDPVKEEEKEEGPPARPSEELPAAAERPSEPVGDVPQCRMGGRTVDNMCFMISCTNWY